MIIVCSDWSGLVGVPRILLCFITSLGYPSCEVFKCAQGTFYPLRNIWRYWGLLQSQWGGAHGSREPCYLLSDNELPTVFSTLESFCFGHFFFFFVLRVDASLTPSSSWGNQGFYSLNDFPKAATFKYCNQDLITSIGAQSCSCYDKYLPSSYLTLVRGFFIFPCFLNVNSSGHLGLTISTTPHIQIPSSSKVEEPSFFKLCQSTCNITFTFLATAVWALDIFLIAWFFLAISSQTYHNHVQVHCTWNQNLPCCVA